jgi:tetratricopeptide (TPR) repeat protein
MGQHEWYRNTIWTEDTKKAFFSRLGRSRSAFNKAQYLCIQASYLQQTMKKENIIEALKLLDMMFADCPEPLELASAHLQRAKCFELLGDYDSAMNSYRESIRAEHTHTMVRVGAGLYFTWFVTRHGLTQLYDEAMSVIDVREHDLLFPFHQIYIFFGPCNRWRTFRQD